MWNGGNGEITRPVVVNGNPQTEFIVATDPQFRNFRCVTVADAEDLIRSATRACPAQQKLSSPKAR